MLRELESTAFCILFRISLDRTPKILLISTSGPLDYRPPPVPPPSPPPPKKNVHDDVQLYDLVSWVLFCKLPTQWLVLLCLLRIILRSIFQPWTSHFHSQHPHGQSRVHPVGSNESEFCVSIFWLVQRFGLHRWPPRRNRIGKLDDPLAFQKTAPLVQHYPCPCT